MLPGGRAVAPAGALQIVVPAAERQVPGDPGDPGGVARLAGFAQAAAAAATREVPRNLRCQAGGRHLAVVRPPPPERQLG
eukprot:189982-Prorocentrum_minimum.AAC.1